MVMRIPGGYGKGWGGKNRNPTRPHKPGSVHGLLTAVRQNQANERMTHYVCACGNELLREHSTVDRSVRNGLTPACSNGCKARKR